MPSLEDNIKKDLVKTGFPTEIKANRILNDRRWYVHTQYTFPDETENKLRSIDFMAEYFIILKDTFLVNSKCELFIECKKSSNRYWVFHSDSGASSQLRKLIRDSVRKVERNLLFDEEEKENIGLQKIADHFSPDFVPVKVAQSYQIALGNRNSRDDFYEAQHQVLKAIKYSSASDLKTTLIYPVILFDGKLYECNLIEEELEISEISYIRYLSSGLPEEPLSLFIDVMTLEYFPTYLELVEEEVKELSKQITS